MKCPVCKEATLTMAERQGFEIDYCAFLLAIATPSRGAELGPDDLRRDAAA